MFLKNELNREFEMKDLSATKMFLGMQIIRGKKQKLIVVSMWMCEESELQVFMSDAKPVLTPLVPHFKLYIK